MNAIELKKIRYPILFCFLSFSSGIFTLSPPFVLEETHGLWFLRRSPSKCVNPISPTIQGGCSALFFECHPITNFFFLSLGCAIFQNGSQEFQNDLQNPRLNVHFCCCCCYLRPGVLRSNRSEVFSVGQLFGNFFSRVQLHPKPEKCCLDEEKRWSHEANTFSIIITTCKTKNKS